MGQGTVPCLDILNTPRLYGSYFSYVIGVLVTEADRPALDVFDDPEMLGVVLNWITPAIGAVQLRKIAEEAPWASPGSAHHKHSELIASIELVATQIAPILGWSDPKALCRRLFELIEEAADGIEIRRLGDDARAPRPSDHDPVDTATQHSFQATVGADTTDDRGIRDEHDEDEYWEEDVESRYKYSWYLVYDSRARRSIVYDGRPAWLRPEDVAVTLPIDEAFIDWGDSAPVEEVALDEETNLGELKLQERRKERRRAKRRRKRRRR